jgi:hypothetical protein
MTTTNLHVPDCPLRGHAHGVVYVRLVTQRGTGKQAIIWQCPNGYNRWFQTSEHNHEGRPLSDYTRTKRPRWGWKEKA